MIQPLISIAMCTYNGEEYLKEQLNSILKQTYTNIEIIISDDCSSDSTVEIIKNYQEKDAKNAPNGPPIAFLSGHPCRLTSGHQ